MNFLKSCDFFPHMLLTTVGVLSEMGFVLSGNNKTEMVQSLLFQYFCNT